jgi:hypothetical protein
MQLAVDAVADALRRLSALQDQVYGGHRAALGNLQVARHHPLKAAYLSPIEKCFDHLAKRLDWPRGVRSRAPNEHLDRPLGDRECRMIASWGASAFALTVGMLDIYEQLGDWYADLVVSAAGAARAAAYKVTVKAHKTKADTLLLRLDRLCADQRVAWAFPVPGEDDDGWRSMSGRRLH